MKLLTIAQAEKSLPYKVCEIWITDNMEMKPRKQAETSITIRKAIENYGAYYIVETYLLLKEQKIRLTLIGKSKV